MYSLILTRFSHWYCKPLPSYSSSWWWTPIRALSYWRLDIKCPCLQSSSSQCVLWGSEAERPLNHAVLGCPYCPPVRSADGQSTAV